MRRLSVLLLLLAAAFCLTPRQAVADECIDGDCQNGKGVQQFGEIGKYEGEFKDGFRSGKGTMTYVDMCQYVGDWQKGFRHGKGVMTCPNGKKWEGDWQDDRLKKNN